MFRCLFLSCLLTTTCAHAQYQPHAIWQREGAGDSSLYGVGLLALGDQNSDSFNDWAVVGLGWGGPGGISEPKVEFFHGGNPPETVPYMVRVTQTTDEEYLYGATGLGDINGDGYNDWAIIVELADDPLERNTYKVYFGGPGPHDVPALVLTAPLLSSFRGIGDFNGDGYDDLMLADSWGDSTCVYFGSNPMDTLPDWTLPYCLFLDDHAGDFNGDGFADLVGRTIAVDGTYIFLGSRQPETTPSFTQLDARRKIINDVNGDGYDDLCVSQSGGAAISWGGLTLDTTVRLRMGFPCSGVDPMEIYSAGDFNHDGFGDVVMISYTCPDSPFGTLTLHLGNRWANTSPSLPLLTVYGWEDPLNLICIRTACNLGDINGDHVDDLAIGAAGDNAYLAFRGKVVILGGDSTLQVDANEPFSPHPSSLILSAFPNPFNGECTVSLSLPAYARDVDLTLFNVLGQRVLTDKLHAQGLTLSYHLNANRLSAGLYLLRASSDGLQSTVKLMLMK